MFSDKWCGTDCGVFNELAKMPTDLDFDRSLSAFSAWKDAFDVPELLEVQARLDAVRLVERLIGTTREEINAVSIHESVRLRRTRDDAVMESSDSEIEEEDE